MVVALFEGWDMLFTSGATVFGLFLFYSCRLAFGYHNSLPPGPKKRFLIGNLLDAPTRQPWLTYRAWAKEYKRLQSSRRKVLKIFRQVGQCSSTFGAILTKKYRPQSVMVNDLPRTTSHVYRLMDQLLVNPEDFMNLINRIMYSLAYGLSTHPTNDSYIRFGDEVAQMMGDTMIPASATVDAMPGFKRKAREWRQLTAGFHETPFDAAVAAIADGTALPSFTSKCLEDSGSGDEAYYTRIVRDTAGLYRLVANSILIVETNTAGTASTSAVMYTFVLAMLCFPAVQAKVQEELDHVIGRERLPELTDEPYTPYLSAVIKETLRWRPVSPMGMAHFVQEDDNYSGYHIPAKSIVIANVWAMLHDENDYPDPESFNPDRFLSKGELRTDIRDPVFDHLWIWQKISKPVTAEGKVKEPSMVFTSSVTCSRRSGSQPEPFECEIKPRFRETPEVIRTAVATTE
ncbi:cytochrome P450 [Coprinopsis sp. MPI-PUGE-AT-0042]|nr:cytochrome P450 [Coprinopsis sp. MPI-PUGE-AT-0042]